MTVTYTVGDTRDVMATIADGSVDLIASSPPFLALRSYLPADHEHKHDEIGSERNPAEYIDMLLGLTAEWGRVLAPHGSLAIELGDTYSGSGGAGGDYNEGGLRDGQGVWESQAARARAWKMDPSASGYGRGKQIRPGGTNGEHWPRAKSLALIPQLYAVALAYGINPLTGAPSPAGRWLVRNVIVWHRPNPAVGALGDKVRPSTSYIVIATRSPKRWFDLTAVRAAHKPNGGDTRGGISAVDGGSRMGNRFEHRTADPAGAPPLDAWFDQYDGTHDTWTLTTQPSSLPHYACVDDQTQALTRDGWKYHHELRDGDAIAAYNRGTKTISWQAATFHRYDFDGDLVAVDKRTTSQRLTPNHRVLVSDRNGNEKVVLAEDLRPNHRLPLAAPFNDDRTPTIGPSLAELIGWYITEGSERLHTVDIYQSATVNEANCKRITWLLDEIGATYSVTDRQRNTLSAHVDWTERRWTISGIIAATLKDLAPAKRLTPDLVFRSSHSELRALLDGLIGGDGHTRPNGRRSFIQQNPETMDMVQALCCRLSIRSTIGPNTAALSLTLGSRTATTLRGTNGKHEPIGREPYAGIVWCPSVPATFWLARRNGRPFITGNTWPAKLAERLILMMCPAQVCRDCGEPRRRASGFDHQPRLAAHIKERREAMGYTIADVNGWFGYTVGAAHWETTTESFARVPSQSDWAVLKERLRLSDEFDAIVMGDRHWKAGPADYVTSTGDVHDGISRDITKTIANGFGGHTGKRDGSTLRRDVIRGWTDCGHDDYRPGVTLDPFCGSGTTMATADLHGRDAIGIDIDARNKAIYPRRYDEVKRALYGTAIPDPMQGVLL